MRALGPSNCSGLWKTRRNDQGLPHGLEATKRGERSATPLWTNRFLPNKRPAQAMINWHGLNIQAGGSLDCRLSIADFGLASADKANRQLAIRKNRKTHPLPRGGTDLISSVLVSLLPTTREQAFQLQTPVKERLCFIWRRPLILAENKKLVPTAVGARPFIHFIEAKQRVSEVRAQTFPG